MTYVLCALAFLAGGIVGSRWAYHRAFRLADACDRTTARALRSVLEGTAAGSDMMPVVRQLATALERMSAKVDPR